MSALIVAGQNLGEIEFKHTRKTFKLKPCSCGGDVILRKVATGQKLNNMQGGHYLSECLKCGKFGREYRTRLEAATEHNLGAV